MIPASLKVPVPFEYAFPNGALALGVEPITDFDKRGQGDDQARDKDTGERLWGLNLMDLDPQATRFGRDRVKVKIAAPVQPVLPDSAVPGYPPEVAPSTVDLSRLSTAEPVPVGVPVVDEDQTEPVTLTRPGSGLVPVPAGAFTRPNNATVHSGAAQ